MNHFQRAEEILVKPKDLISSTEYNELSSIFANIDEIRDKVGEKNSPELILKCSKSLELKRYEKGFELTLQGEEMLFFGILLEGQIGVYQRKNTSELSQSNNQLKQFFSSLDEFRDKNELTKSKQSNLNTNKPTHKIKMTNNAINHVGPLIVKKFIKNTETHQKPNEIEGSNSTYQTLNPEENLIFSNEFLRSKYFHDMNCTLKFVKFLNAGDSIHSKGMFQDLKSPYTYICSADCKIAEIKKIKFSTIFDDKILLVGKKIEFVKEFFGYPEEDSFNKLMKTLHEIEYRLGDQIYKESDSSDGLYFIIEGEVKLTKTATFRDFEEDFDKNNLQIKKHIRREIEVRIITPKEFFGDEEFFNLNRLHNARAASHYVLALHLPSNMVSSLKFLAPVTLEIIHKVAKKRLKSLKEDSFENKLNIYNPPPTIKDNPLKEKFYESEMREQLKSKSKDSRGPVELNNTYFKYYRVEHKLKVKPSEKINLSFEDLLTNKLYFTFRNTKYCRKNEYIRKVIEEKEMEEKSPKTARARTSPDSRMQISPNRTRLKYNFSEPRVMMTETSIDYSPKQSSREVTKIEGFLKKSNTQSIFENVSLSDYFLPRGSQMSRNNMTNLSTRQQTNTSNLMGREKKKFLNSSYLMSDSRRLSTEGNIQEAFRSKSVKLQDSETQTFKAADDQNALESQDLKEESKKQKLQKLKKQLSYSKVIIKSHHNLFRMKPKDKLILTERYII